MDFLLFWTHREAVSRRCCAAIRKRDPGGDHGLSSGALFRTHREAESRRCCAASRERDPGGDHGLSSFLDASRSSESTLLCSNSQERSWRGSWTFSRSSFPDASGSRVSTLLCSKSRKSSWRGQWTFPRSSFLDASFKYICPHQSINHLSSTLFLMTTARALAFFSWQLFFFLGTTSNNQQATSWLSPQQTNRNLKPPVGSPAHLAQAAELFAAQVFHRLAQLPRPWSQPSVA